MGFSKFFLSAFLVVVFFSSLSAFGNKNCQITIGHRLSHELAVYDGVTYRVESFLPGKHGGKRMLLRLKANEKDWFSVNPVGAGQGSPELTYTALTPNLREHFGVERGRDQFGEFYIVPNVDEWNGAVAEYNQNLAAGAPKLLGFYSERNLKAPARKYNKKFRFSRLLPVSEEGPYVHHDLNLHVPATVCYVEELAQQYDHFYDAFFDFEQFLRRRHPWALKSPHIQLWLESRQEDLSHVLDSSTFATVASQAEGGYQVVAMLGSDFFEGRGPQFYFSKNAKEWQRALIASGEKDPKFRDFFLLTEDGILGEFLREKLGDRGFRQSLDSSWLEGGEEEIELFVRQRVSGRVHQVEREVLRQKAARSQ